MTILQIIQLTGGLIGIISVIVALVVFIMKMDGKVSLHSALLERVEKKIDSIDSAISGIQAAIQGPQPRRAGRGKRTS